MSDLNGDGNLDAVAVIGEGGSIGYAILGNGSGGLYPTGPYSGEFGAGSGAVAIGDFTGDGIPDVVTSQVDLAVSRGLGNGTFAPTTVVSANGYAQTGLAVADFNGDGKLDAVTAIPDTGTIAEFLGNGDATLTYAGEFAVGSSPAAVAVGDFNGDGRPDVVAANAGASTVSVLLNDGTWPPLPPPPTTIHIRDVTVSEGNMGAVGAAFTVTLSATSTHTITVAYATGDGTATAGGDYQAVSNTLIFAPGETSKTITVPVNGDRLAEPNEMFFVNLSSPTNAVINDGQGVGNIVDDEPRISISDVSRSEGRKGQTSLFTFTVSLSAAYDQTVTMSYRTVNGTATTSNSDYVARTGTLTFAPGETTKTITIEVKGDSKREGNETFYLDLFGNSGNSLFTRNRGIGTILNDD